MACPAGSQFPLGLRAWRYRGSDRPPLSRNRQRKEEGRPLTRVAFHPDAAAISFDNAGADGEPQPRPGYSLAMEPFQNAENLGEVLRLDSDSVVGYTETPEQFLPLNADVNTRRGITAVLDRIRNQ